MRQEITMGVNSPETGDGSDSLVAGSTCPLHPASSLANRPTCRLRHLLLVLLYSGWGRRVMRGEVEDKRELES